MMETITDYLSRVLLWIGGLLVIGAILVTVGDVIARWLFKTGFIGLVDVTQFAVVGFAYLALPHTFSRDAHVAIALYDHRLSPHSDLLLRSAARLLTLGVLGILLYYGWVQAERTLRYGAVSQNVEIPMIAFWIMILTGAALSAIICLTQLTVTLGQLLHPPRR